MRIFQLRSQILCSTRYEVTCNAAVHRLGILPTVFFMVDQNRKKYERTNGQMHYQFLHNKTKGKLICDWIFLNYCADEEDVFLCTPLVTFTVSLNDSKYILLYKLLRHLAGQIWRAEFGPQSPLWAPWHGKVDIFNWTSLNEAATAAVNKAQAEPARWACRSLEILKNFCFLSWHSWA